MNTLPQGIANPRRTRLTLVAANPPGQAVRGTLTVTDGAAPAPGSPSSATPAPGR
jgi:hypothetical protein